MSDIIVQKFGGTSVGSDERIAAVAQIIKKAKKDKHSTMGLTKSVNKRKKLLAYLKRKNPASYTNVLKQLNLRK